MSYVNSEDFKEWRKNHLWNEEYIPISGAKVNGDLVIIFYCKSDEKPFSVQYRGNGHYFKTYEGAHRYAGRRFERLFPISADDLMKI